MAFSATAKEVFTPFLAVFTLSLLKTPAILDEDDGDNDGCDGEVMRVRMDGERTGHVL